MYRYFKNWYNKIALHLYHTGKHQHIDYWAGMMKKKVTTGKDTRFTEESNIINLADDPAKIRVGENCNISGLMLVYRYGGEIIMGDHCSLSPLSRIISTKKIKIGDRVLIGHNVNIIDNISHPLDAARRHEDYIQSFATGMQEHDLKSEAIIIEDDVWIGFNSTILRGVTIGRGAIIGAGTMVTKDIEAWTVNVGNPPRIVNYLKDQKPGTA